MRKMIAAMLVAAFGLGFAGAALTNGGCLHGTTAQTPVPAMIAETPVDTTKTTTKPEPGAGG